MKKIIENLNKYLNSDNEFDKVSIIPMISLEIIQKHFSVNEIIWNYRSAYNISENDNVLEELKTLMLLISDDIIGRYYDVLEYLNNPKNN